MYGSALVFFTLLGRVNLILPTSISHSEGNLTLRAYRSLQFASQPSIGFLSRSSLGFKILHAFVSSSSNDFIAKFRTSGPYDLSMCIHLTDSFFLSLYMLSFTLSLSLFLSLESHRDNFKLKSLSFICIYISIYIAQWLECATICV